MLSGVTLNTNSKLFYPPPPPGDQLFHSSPSILARPTDSGTNQSKALLVARVQQELSVEKKAP